MSASRQVIELLAPAKDLATGMAAIDHGADAVYIGAPRFSARSAAGNTVDEIKTLCDYAHLFGVKIYVALNTILKEEELSEAEKLVWELYYAGIDALIVQDMGLTLCNLPPLPLHASTQTDNRTPEKVRFLEQTGFTQVVLARELSLNDIRKIAEDTHVRLEAFVHGALCVSYSGQCYLSAALSGRSANRGECAQYCRLPYTLTDADGQEIIKDKHLLSLKDMNRTENLEVLMDAGISAFKIEGRLKDISYVKNVTAWYRKKIDAILSRRKEFTRASDGNSRFSFEPQPEKSFNRGFTNYFLKGRTEDITSFDTPKSLGEPVGRVKEMRKNGFTVAGIPSLHNGDGLSFFNKKGGLEGFRVNRVEDNLVFPAEMPVITPKTLLYRNHDQEFERSLSKPSAERKIAVEMVWRDIPFGFSLEIKDKTGACVVINQPFEKELAQKPQQENIERQLGKLGNTIFEATKIQVEMSENWFVPSSLLAEFRRLVVDKLLSCRKIRYQREWIKQTDLSADVVYPEKKLDYRGNVSNSKAVAFYRMHGVEDAGKAFELEPKEGVPVMFTRHCLRYSLGICPVHQKKPSPYKEPLYLQYRETLLRLEFDCKQCIMRILIDNK